MDDTVKKILAKRRDRMIATILSFKEDECDEYLPNDVSVDLRKLVLDQINDYFDLCSDLLKSVQPEGMIVNEHYADVLEEIHATIVRN
jgi:hypothetical protein